MRCEESALTAEMGKKLNEKFPAFRAEIQEQVNQAVESIEPVVIEGDVSNAADEEDLTSVDTGSGEVLKLKDKAYSPLTYSGLGRKYLRKNMVGGVNKLTQEMVADDNTIYSIQYDYDLDGATVTMPAGAILKFEGGSLKNGTIVGDGTQIDATDYDVLFRNATFTGTWNVKHASICWFGAVRSTTTDKHDIAVAFQSAMSFPCNEVYVPRGLWYVGTTLQMNKFKQLRLEGESTWGNATKDAGGKQAELFTDLNITMLEVDGANINDVDSNDNDNRMFGIVGGAFDVSRAPASSGYNKAVINIVNTQAGNAFRCHKATIATTIRGRVSISELQQGTAINVALQGGSSYISNFTTNCNIIQILNGIKIKASLNNGEGWITDYVECSNIRAVKGLDLDLYSAAKINGNYQTLVYYAGETNDYSWSYINCPRLEVNGIYWDLYASSGSGDNIKRGARYAIELGPNCNKFIPTSMMNYYASIGWIKNPDTIIFMDNNYEKYTKYPDNNVKSYNDFNNFFVDNPIIGSFSIVAESGDPNDNAYADRVSFQNFDKIFSPYKNFAQLPKITYTLAENEDLHESDKVKMTINLTDTRQFSLFGLTHRNGTFESINVKFYSNNTLTYEETQTPSIKKNDLGIKVYYDRLFFLNPNKFADKIEVTLIKPLANVDEILDFIGIAKYDPCHYISSAGGDLHKPVSWDGKILINPQIYEDTSALPSVGNYRAGSICVFKDANGETALGVHDGANWRMVSLQWITQPLFRTNLNGNGKNNYYFNTSSKTIKAYFESDSQWHEFDGCKNGILRAGNVSQKPASSDVIANFEFFAYDLHKPIFVDKSGTNKYVEADGATAGVARSGDTASRPASGIYVGFQYFDTTLGKVIVWDGSDWKNVDGSALS